MAGRSSGLRRCPTTWTRFVKAQSVDSPAHVANQVKGYTARVLRVEFASLRSRLPTLWSRSYFAATVGAVSAADDAPVH
ncbi:transposase [Dactylosporangium cerinum]|uniref:Transposase n=1 Tax=Dactylosporangium cerinum TaxID=1434730 RepID=A0ABV9W7K3_9ACTN